MSENEKSEKLRQKEERARAFKSKLEATGLRPMEFAQEAGFTRNVLYNLSIGQAPSSPEQADRLEAAFERLRKHK